MQNKSGYKCAASEIGKAKKRKGKSTLPTDWVGQGPNIQWKSRRLLKSTPTLDKSEKSLAGKKFPFNDQFECENFLLLQLMITSKLKV